jgi:hypothetical protein
MCNEAKVPSRPVSTFRYDRLVFFGRRLRVSQYNMALPLVEATGYVVAFVAAVYAFPSTRTTDSAARDSPPVVRRRCFSIALLSVACLYLTAWRRQVPLTRILYGLLMGETAASAVYDTASTADVIRRSFEMSLRGISVTATLFAGVLLNRLFDDAREIVADSIEALTRDAVAARDAAILKGNQNARVAQPSAVQWLGAVVKAGAMYPWSAVHRTFSDSTLFWVRCRNLVVSPIVEEIVLRYMPIDAMERGVLVGRPLSDDCVLTRYHVSTLLASGARASAVPALLLLVNSPARRMWWSAALFALSHAHHGVRHYHTERRYLAAYYERYVALNRGYAMPSAEAIHKESMHTAVKTMVRDATITMAFGLLSSWILLRRADGAAIAPLASHSLCNMIGAPSLRYLFEDRRDLVPGTTRGGRIVPQIVVMAERVVITLGHVFGVLAFGSQVAGLL